jgi:hypothetical protein
VDKKDPENIIHKLWEEYSMSYETDFVGAGGGDADYFVSQLDNRRVRSITGWRSDIPTEADQSNCITKLKVETVDYWEANPTVETYVVESYRKHEEYKPLGRVTSIGMKPSSM